MAQAVEYTQLSSDLYGGASTAVGWTVIATSSNTDGFYAQASEKRRRHLTTLERGLDRMEGRLGRAV